MEISEIRRRNSQHSSAKCKPASYEEHLIGRPQIEESLPWYDQIGVHDCVSALFYTESGYRGGNIIADKVESQSYSVIFTRDEQGNEIWESAYVPKHCRIRPKRLYKKRVWIHLQLPKADIVAEGFVRSIGNGPKSELKSAFAGNSLELGEGLGSGVHGTKRGQKEHRYPIYHALNLHEFKHKDLLICGSSFLLQIVNEYLETGKVSALILDQTSWLINAVLYIDDHPLISKELLLEAVHTFCYDYYHFPKGQPVRQPINYLFDAARIDGIYSDTTCISYISSDFEGITYEYE